MDTSTPDQLDNKRPHFANIWGTKETRLSSLIAQTIVLSNKFRRFIANHFEKESFSIDFIRTEYSFEGRNQIDILIKCLDGLLIGIENKKWAWLQGLDQLFRYEESLKKESKNQYKLILLSPSTYKLSGSSKPNNLIKIDYKEIYNWIDLQSFNSDFEKYYFELLRLYFDALELENQPFTYQEINDLKDGIPTAINKLRWIISSIKPENAKINQSVVSGYYSYGLNVFGFPVYVGFRCKQNTRWFKQPLLQNQPECLIYIHDNWNDVERDEKNQQVKQVFNILQPKVASTIELNDLKNKNECRLSIRKSLIDFEGKDISNIVLWFEEIFNLLKEAIEEILRNDFNTYQDYRYKFHP